jgi:hypothetical protein
VADLVPVAPAEVAVPVQSAEDADVRRMLYRVTRTLANANRQLGRRADVEALVRESWRLLGLMPDGSPHD